MLINNPINVFFKKPKLFYFSFKYEVLAILRISSFLIELWSTKG